ncbi:MAG: esterase-like activity of phytase family protein [Pseudomonadota bacterium]
MLQRIALWGPLLIAALLAGGYIYIHQPFARDGTELLQVPLSEEEPELDRVGDLKYLGGLDIPRMDQNIGGLSGLRWDAESGRLLAITDDARWVWLDLQEDGYRLVGLEQIESGPLLGLNGEPLQGKEQGDSESLTQLGKGAWLIGFERNHRVLLYVALDGAAAETAIDAEATLGPLEENAGLETLVFGTRVELYCVERQAAAARSNCMRAETHSSEPEPFSVEPPAELSARGGVPTDADVLGDDTLVVLFRSYSPAEGNAAAIATYSPDGTRREIATFLPPLTVDNFEGLAVREEEDRIFLYIVSDDNFSGSQRTLLMKFELLKEL